MEGAGVWSTPPPPWGELCGVPAPLATLWGHLHFLRRPVTPLPGPPRSRLWGGLTGKDFPESLLCSWRDPTVGECFQAVPEPPQNTPQSAQKP